MDIKTDTTIPEGTVAFGYYKGDNQVVITNLKKFPEEKKTLSDEIYDMARNNITERSIRAEKVEQSLKEFIGFVDVMFKGKEGFSGDVNQIDVDEDVKELNQKAKEIFGDRLI